MAMSTIGEKNQDRHAHRDPDDLEFCRRCGAFVNKGESDAAGRAKYRCSGCGHAIMEYVGANP